MKTVSDRVERALERIEEALEAYSEQLSDDEWADLADHVRDIVARVGDDR